MDLTIRVYLIVNFGIYALFKELELNLKGRQADKDGRIELWWTNETLNRYIKGAQCFIEQYGNYTFPQFAGTEAFQVNQT